METKTVTNRTNSIRKCTWDGRHYELAPGATEIFTAEVANQFKRWNIQMGSLDPCTGQITYLVGVKEDGDPLEPLTQEILIDPSTGKPHVEVWNRDQLTGARPSKVVAGDNGLYATRDWKSGQNTDLNFDGRE